MEKCICKKLTRKVRPRYNFEIDKLYDFTIREYNLHIFVRVFYNNHAYHEFSEISFKEYFNTIKELRKEKLEKIQNVQNR